MIVRANISLIDVFIDSSAAIPRSFEEIFANPVERDDRIIERVTDDGEHRGNDGQVERKARISKRNRPL